MKRPARRAPGRRSGRAQSCRAQSGFALHDAILARTAGTLYRTMVRAQRVGNTPSSSFFLLPGEQREGGPAHMRETVERGRSWHPPSAGRERGEQAVVVGKGQRVAVRDRHRRLVEDGPHVARLDPVSGPRAHEDVVDAPRLALEARSRLSGLAGSHVPGGRAASGRRAATLAKPAALSRRAVVGSVAGSLLKSPASTTVPSKGAPAASIASAICALRRSGAPRRRRCR